MKPLTDQLQLRDDLVIESFLFKYLFDWRRAKRECMIRRICKMSSSFRILTALCRTLMVPMTHLKLTFVCIHSEQLHLDPSHKLCTCIKVLGLDQDQAGRNVSVTSSCQLGAHSHIPRLTYFPLSSTTPPQPIPSFPPSLSVTDGAQTW